MIGISFWRVLRAALQNFFRNIWLSIATTVIMVITLLIVMMLYFANIFGLEIIKNVEQKVDLSITFKPTATEEQIQHLVDDLNNRSDVATVEYVSSEQALQIFKANNQDRPYIEESLQELEINPLPASLFIVAEQPIYYQEIAKYLSGNKYSEILDIINYEDSRAVIDKMILIITTIKNTGLIITGIFALLVVLIMFNTIRLAIYSFREEIDIMRLVGASRWFIRGPFVVESVLVALTAVVTSTIILYPTLNAIAPQLKRFFFSGFTERTPYDVYAYAVDQWPIIMGIQLAVAIGLAILSSLIAVQRYLKT